MPTNWRHIPLPKRPLTPLLHTYTAEFWRRLRSVAPIVGRLTIQDVRERREFLHLRRDRPFRVINQRRRLIACYWAGWSPRRGVGVAGPLWLWGRP